MERWTSQSRHVCRVHFSRVLMACTLFIPLLRPQRETAFVVVRMKGVQVVTSFAPVVMTSGNEFLLFKSKAFVGFMFPSKKEVMLFTCSKSVREKKPFVVVKSNSKRFLVSCETKSCDFLMFLQTKRLSLSPCSPTTSFMQQPP